MLIVRDLQLVCLVAKAVIATPVRLMKATMIGTKVCGDFQPDDKSDEGLIGIVIPSILQQDLAKKHTANMKFSTLNRLDY